MCKLVEDTIAHILLLFFIHILLTNKRLNTKRFKM